MPGRRPVTVLVLCCTVAALVAGCGAGSARSYTAAGTMKCLAAKGFTGLTTDPLKVGFIAGVAENGGIKATAPGGNVLTIAFAQDAASASSTEDAFRANATPFYKRHMSDIMEAQRNAVLVWTTAPNQTLLGTAEACLGS